MYTKRDMEFRASRPVLDRRPGFDASQRGGVVRGTIIRSSETLIRKLPLYTLRCAARFSGTGYPPKKPLAATVDAEPQPATPAEAPAGQPRALILGGACRRTAPGPALPSRAVAGLGQNGRVDTWQVWVISAISAVSTFLLPIIDAGNTCIHPPGRPGRLRAPDLSF